jgi:aldose 1-epimerase
MIRIASYYTLFVLFAFIFLNCNPRVTTTEVANDSIASAPIVLQKEKFGSLPDGREVQRFILRNKNGVEVHVINYGGIITHLMAPDRNGKIQDIVLGYDSLDGYLKATPYFGAIVGRYGNRIANGKFSLDGKEYTLVQNNNGQHLHGGTTGFDKVFWDISEIDSSGMAIRLSYLSKDMEEGYPGNLNVKVDYRLTDENELKIDYTATTDKPTVVNLTQHTYFNLSGNAVRDITDHILTLNADQYIPVSKVLIPTGKPAPVENTPFDFNTPTRLGERINANHEQLKLAGGYDHCWVLAGPAGMKTAGMVYDSISGRTVEVLTTEPGIQFYSGNFLDGSITGKGGVVYKHRHGLCLETEHFPDSPNQPQFPTVVLRPGETYKSQTTYKFGVK